MTPTSLRTYYLIATYGKRSALNITLNQSAAVQIANLRHYLPPNADRKDLFLGDYARKIHQLADLPVLRSTLLKLETLQKGELIMDDISRLFRLCDHADRLSLFKDLKQFDSHIFSLRHNSRLSGFTEIATHLLLEKPEAIGLWHIKAVRKRNISNIERADATKEARIASLQSRKSAATKRDAQMIELKEELITSGQSHASADVAAEANQRGLRTSRGLPWSDRSVRDAIRHSKGHATK